MSKNNNNNKCESGVGDRTIGFEWFVKKKGLDTLRCFGKMDIDVLCRKKIKEAFFSKNK